MQVPVSGVERSSDAGAWAVLALFGEIDLSVVPQVREAVDELVSGDRVKLVWDLAGVSFMDSAGLGVLVYTMRSVEASGGSVRLAGADAQVRRMLELTGLDTVIEGYPDVASAAGRPTG
ncbi:MULTISPECIES: STAS domain-containing protein [Streptomyces]|uniref:Anti-sigma factor antagonist n=1 Tax=Streptomyces albus (strain ATCC 21838 / DSM 41398 / FERM P-419 / JCM 4703 / NBRC 107858) TaxID=1081613 RepID=A0A0B5EPW0_STRA4|nr:STAS domain-containing protein [Streptomyces sp. SCSIO ZS0520]AJE83654.1 putative anti-sigma factor antagonist [Streptomyces albus]AOU77962.1 putative anti-sigma factor antagonist [Streptomyces albus]AYN33717.1 anti-sigma factor antagonist [Streptomyces albus]